MQQGIIIGFAISIGVPILFFVLYKMGEIIDNFPLRERLSRFFIRNKALIQDFKTVKTNAEYAIATCNGIDTPYASAFSQMKFSAVEIEEKIKNQNFGHFFVENTHIANHQIIFLVKCDYRTYRELTPMDFDVPNSFYTMNNGKPVLVKVGDETETGIYIFYQYFCIKQAKNNEKITVFGYLHPDFGESLMMKAFAKEILDKITA